jgi:phosphoribosylformylglycinamidine synthase
VSFYNQSVIGDKTEPVYPTPTIGMIGILADANRMCTLGFRQAEDCIFLVGEVTDDLGCSEYLHHVKGVEFSPAPWFDLDGEFSLHEAIRAAIGGGWVKSAHDISEGGLIITLMECAFPEQFGFRIITDNAVRKDAFLFGESQGRVVLSVAAKDRMKCEEEFGKRGIPVRYLGNVTQGEIQVDSVSFGNVGKWRELYGNVLHTYLDN